MSAGWKVGGGFRIWSEQRFVQFGIRFPAIGADDYTARPIPGRLIERYAMPNPALFRDLLSALAVGCNMKIEFEDDSEYVEFATDMGLQFYLMQTDRSPAITLAIPIKSASAEEMKESSLAAGMLNSSEILTEHGKIGVMPDMSAMIYLSKWREHYGIDQERICHWVTACLSEADRCKGALVDLQDPRDDESPIGGDEPDWVKRP